jgi:hypothetical protein
MMAPGWLHGCVGLHVLLNRRPLSQTAVRAVRPPVMAGTLRTNYSHERARPRPAGLAARAK